MADLIPWMNVGAAWRRVTGDKSRGDEDILPWISKNGGARDFKYSSSAPGVVSFQGDVKKDWVDNGKGGYSYLAPATNTGNKETIVNNDPVFSSLAVDPAYAAAVAKRNANNGKAKGIKDRLLGRRGDIDSILNDIMSKVDGLLTDKKGKRQKQYDGDTAALIDSLNAAIPEIQKSFASLGLSSSTFLGDRVDSTNQEYKKSQKSVDDKLNDDLSSYGQWADSEKGNARASADKARNSMKYVEDSEASADNLGQFQKTENEFDNMMTDFGNQRNQYTTSGAALDKLNSIGTDYNFDSILNSFASLAGSAADTGMGGGAAKTVAEAVKGVGDKQKKKLTEVQVNNPVGAAAA